MFIVYNNFDKIRINRYKSRIREQKLNSPALSQLQNVEFKAFAKPALDEWD